MQPLRGQKEAGAGSRGTALNWARGSKRVVCNRFKKNYMYIIFIICNMHSIWAVVSRGKAR